MHYTRNRDTKAWLGCCSSRDLGNDIVSVCYLSDSIVSLYTLRTECAQKTQIQLPLLLTRRGCPDVLPIRESSFETSEGAL